MALAAGGFKFNLAEICIMSINTFHIAVGEAVTITATSAATYYPIPAGVPGTPVTIAAGASSALIGPFGTPRDYAVDSEIPATYVYSTPDPFASGDSVTSPTFVAPVLGTPASGDLSNCTSTSQVFVTPALGTVASGDVSACDSTSQTLTTPTVSAPAITDGSATDMNLVSPVIGSTGATTITAGAGAPDSAVQASLSRNPAGDENGLTFTAVEYGTPGNDLTITYVAPVIATLNINPAGDENALDFTAVAWGTGGNAITIEYVDPSDIDQTISVDVVGSAITISLDTDGAGAITTTAAQLITAYELVSDATDLATVAIDASDTGVADDGSGIVTAMASAPFTGGLGIGPGQSTEATVAIDGDDLTVHLETDAGGVITTTAAELITAWEADGPAVALATVAIDASDGGGLDDGSGIVTALAAANFTSGVGTGIGTAGIGSLHIDWTNGKLYINGGTLGVPVWNIVTSA